MNEIFKDIKGYEGSYQISNLGNVKSLAKSDGNGNRDRILNFDKDTRKNTQYSRVTLSKNGKTKRFQVHRLVAETFIPNPENKPFVNHIDNNGLNNMVTNLEWCTQTENMAHSSNQGRQDAVRLKGGNTTGALRTKASQATWAAYVGTTIGNLIVTSFFYDTELKQPKYKLMCKCLCGNTTSGTLSNLLKGTQMCKECSFKQRKMKI